MLFRAVGFAPYLTKRCCDSQMACAAQAARLMPNLSEETRNTCICKALRRLGLEWSLASA